ncbi:Kinesin-related protein 6 (Kinesin family member 6) (Kinesin-13) [Durusdinium trenchii]|uniref:Kinesin-related protein 6 (Kinesin family member 6) (Kinesin-13) n=1 Tax=Durusdinium trenchii TaxID=1381693 RepID=A0ABP0I6U5_9DINO
MPKPTPKPAPKPTAKPPQKTVTPLAGAGLAGAPGQAKGEKEPRRRSLVMEDLGDAMLHQLSTSAKTAEDTASPALPQEGTAQPKAVDDTVVVRRPKSARVEKVKDDDSEETRQMFDKRELRKRHKELFEQHVDQWRRRQTEEFDARALARCYARGVATALGRKIVIHNCLTTPGPSTARATAGFGTVKAPVNREEGEGGGGKMAHSTGGRWKADLRSLFISHMGFQFAHAFAESVSEDEVYRHCAADAVQHMLAGKVATVFMFGQTGSGKTHTMSGLFRRAAQHIFRSESSVTLTAFEIAGKVMRDLLDQSSKELKIREDKSGKTQILGLQGSDISSPDALLSGLTQAQGGRATRATQVNETSSRSHAVFCITKGDATLTLVDCAGSERREDATQHDARSRKDAAEINSTIFALKECFRVMRSSKGQPPYRESLLTRVLADSFGSAEALVVAIGTVSPAAKDTEHSIGTLRALQQLQGTQMLFDEREDVGKPKAEVEKPKESHPKSWSETEVRQWLEEAAGGRAKQFAACVSKGTDGKNLLRWPNVRFVQLCGGDDDLGNKLYQARCFHVFNELILGTGRLERSGDASNSRPEKQVQCDMSVNPTCS